MEFNVSDKSCDVSEESLSVHIIQQSPSLAQGGVTLLLGMCLLLSLQKPLVIATFYSLKISYFSNLAEKYLQ